MLALVLLIWFRAALYSALIYELGPLPRRGCSRIGFRCQTFSYPSSR